MNFVRTFAVSALLFTGAAAFAPPAALSTADALRTLSVPSPEKRLAGLRLLLDNARLPYEVQTFDSGKPGVGPGRNVVVTLGKGDRDILLTAHYDAKKLADGSYVDGAVDNAASVIALIDAAAQLRKGLPNHRLRIVFFDQEEYGLLGAHAYAATEQAKRVDWVINFDINAYGDTPFFAAEANDAQAATLTTMAKACAAAKTDCLGFEAYPPSDHLAFRKAGVKATSISVLPRDEALGLQSFMASGGKPAAGTPLPRALGLIHTPNDKVEAVDPATIDRVTELAIAAAKAFDAAP